MSTFYPIDTVIPFPDAERRLYPFEQLRLGHSFLVPYVEGPDIPTVTRRVRTVVYRRNKSEPERRYRWRSEDTGVRVWRVA